MNIELSLNWQLNTPEKHHVDPLLFRLLMAIKQQGSLRKATAYVGVSYRFSWGLLTKWQARLGQPLVILERGKGAKLSVVGEKLLNANSQLLSRFSPELDNFSTQFSRDFSALLTQSNSSSLKLYASHGLAISQLRSQLNQHSSVNLDLHFYGSLESLRALNSSQCDIAGFHIPIGPMAHSLAPHYLAQLNAQQHTLIYVVKRNQGLMVKAGNPKGIDSIRSLAHISCEFINRQVGSGTRLLFDQLLQNNNIEPADIEGYQNEEFTHMAVAAMIASGVADVGFGIAPMAEKFELEFIPLIWEHYCLAIPTEIIADERVEHIISLLKNTAFKHELSAYAGYDASHSGDAVSFETIFT